MKTYTFHMHGMHCNACVVLTESELSEMPGVMKAKSSLANHSIEVTGEFGDKSPEEVAAELSKTLTPHGYTLSTEKEKRGVMWSDFKIALPLALGFMAFFVILQKLGIVNLITTGEVNYGTAFLIGFIASISTCMAVVGSLVLSVSANYAKEGSNMHPQVLFHVGRLVAFFVLGGVIGALGSAFSLGVTGTFVMSLVVALVMLVLGVNLLDVFPWAKALQPTLPKFLSNHLLEVKKLNHTLTPVVLGIITFFLPCGFTQSMQIYALSTGSFMTGALTMFVFALGTLPVLLLLSFGSLSIRDKTQSGIFFKTAGLIVIFFAAFNVLNAFVAYGVIPPIFNF